ncbi:hypothetical protein ACFLVN_05980, partial [Chloroflexota bacterium]
GRLLPGPHSPQLLIDRVVTQAPRGRDEKRLRLQQIVLKESEKIDSRIEDFREHLNSMPISDPGVAAPLIKLSELKNTIKESLLNIYSVSKRFL